MRGALLVTVTVAIAAAGCGSSGSRAAAPASTSATAPAAGAHEIATGNTLTEFQRSRLLGHYSTKNGMSGFVLDRTVTPWRARLDGTTKVTALHVSNTPRHGENEYTSDDRAIWIRVDTESGRVLLFQGPKEHEGVDVVRDADAEQLR